jgi:hypothetical protein
LIISTMERASMPAPEGSSTSSTPLTLHADIRLVTDLDSCAPLYSMRGDQHITLHIILNISAHLAAMPSSHTPMYRIVLTFSCSHLQHATWCHHYLFPTLWSAYQLVNAYHNCCAEVSHQHW